MRFSTGLVMIQKSVDKGKRFGTILIDLSEAFGCLSHHCKVKSIWV